MTHLDLAELPYGAFWCPTCLAVKLCDVAYGERRDDPDCILECLTCNTRIGEAVDTIGVWPFPPAETRRSTLTPEQREKGRAMGRKMVLGVFDKPQDAGPEAPPKPPPDFVQREAARIAALRTGRTSR